jgi:cation:H+ antiporter
MGIGYTIFVIRLSRREHDKAVLDEYSEEYGERQSVVKGKLWVSVLLVVVGLVLLVLGSRWLVNACIIMAQAFGLSDLVIGITIIAIGTSLPEVATSVVAAFRGERDIAVGNAVGSSIFNIVFVLGIAATIGGGMHISGAALRLDIPVMIAVAVACLPFFFSGRRLERWEGVVFLFYYCAYTAYLILASQDEDSLEIFTIAMVWFTLPLTVLTLIILTIRELRRSRS